MDTEISKLMTNIDSATWRAARRALERAIELHLGDSNVCHIDLGFRIRTSKGNRIEPELSVRVHVRQKLYGDEFENFASQQPHKVIDAQRIGFAIDVPQASYSLHEQFKSRSNLNKRSELYQELCGGITISNALGHGFGTLGGKVRDRQSGEEMILSTWHVLGGAWNVEQDLKIYQPAHNIDGKKLDAVAQYTRSAISANLDVAVAQLHGQRLLPNDQLGIGPVTGTVIPQLGMRVLKSGASTGVTYGIITGILGYSIHHYDGFNHVIGPAIHIVSEKPEEEICATGDSGAWWLELSSSRAVGMHFAGSADPSTGLALSMPDVLEALNVDIDTEQISRSPSMHISDIDEKKDVKSKTSILLRIKKLIVAVSASVAKYKLPIDQVAKMPQYLRTNKDMVNENIENYHKQILFYWYKYIINNSYKITLVGFLIVLYVLSIKFSHYMLRTHHQQREKIGQLQYVLSHFKAVAQFDSTHRFNIRKIITIIDLYNPKMKTKLKFKIAEEIYEMDLKYRNINVELICATITHETAYTWEPNIVSPAGAMGLMQIMPTTGIYLAKEKGITWYRVEDILFNPIYNIRLGCRYLSSLIDAYGIDGGLAAYNGGEKRAEKWVRNGRGKGILHEETASYIPSILKIYEEYNRMNI